MRKIAQFMCIVSTDDSCIAMNIILSYIHPIC